jgi:two-component system chemotaxis sensor kinase CheA
MIDPMSQYRDLFVQTGKEYLQSLNSALLLLEKEPTNTEAIADIFRAAHSLKGQSAAMGFEQTGYLCHAVEDVFFEVKEGRLAVDSALADLLFEALDSLTASIDHIELDGTELAVGDKVEPLKQHTGIQTSGAGKSTRIDTVQQAAPKAAAAPDTQAVAKEQVKPDLQDVPKAKVSTKPAAKAKPVALEPSKKTDPAPKTSAIKTIPVKVGDLDDIMGSLEELMVHRLAMRDLIKATNNASLNQHQNQVDRLVGQLQFQIMKIRAVPVSMVFDHFPRAVRDLARDLHKQIELKIVGGELALDRTIVERLDEPLTHLMRNAADHGIGESGTITLSARREKDFAVVEVADDGNGVDWAAVAKKAGVSGDDRAVVKKALFSGISTSSEVSLVSGRGVGLEVVKKTIEEFGGSIDVTSEPGEGTHFILRLPLTLSIVQTLIVQVGDQRYGIPLSLIERSVKISTDSVTTNVGQEVISLNNEEIPLLYLHRLFADSSPPRNADTLLVVIVTIDDEKVALAVDAVNQTLESVIKPSPEILRGNPAFSGVTVLGDGRTVLLINPRGLVA